MRALQLSSFHLSTVALLCHLLTAVGVWALLTADGKNGLDAVPLGWMLALVLATPFGAACFVAALRARARHHRWMTIVAGVLFIPAVLIWLWATAGVVHYFG